jgi:hypothetical protein
MSNGLRTFFALKLTLWITMNNVATWCLISAFFLAFLNLNLLKLSKNMGLSLRSIHSLTYEDVHEHNLLLLRTQSSSRTFTWPNSLTWLSLDMHVTFLDCRIRRLLLNFIVEASIGAFIILIFRFRSFLTSSFFLFFLTTRLVTVIYNKCWFVHI